MNFISKGGWGWGLLGKYQLGRISVIRLSLHIFRSEPEISATRDSYYLKIPSFCPWQENLVNRSRLSVFHKLHVMFPKFEERENHRRILTVPLCSGLDKGIRR